VVLAAAVLTVVLAVVLPGDDDGDPVADAADALVAAFERSRTATFVVEQTFTRTAPGGASISYGRRLVQRPPEDRFLVGGGTGEGRLGGRVLRCATLVGRDGGGSCTRGPEAGPYAAEVAAEVAALRALLEGAPPPYEVEALEDPGCFGLTITAPVPSAPYGDEAVFCFDAATGAPTRVEVHRPEAVDVVEAVEIRAEVTDADLDPGDLGDLPG
jgi:hypothetical protein